MMTRMTIPNTPLTMVARRHLPASVAEQWIALIRPGLHLRPAEPDEPEVGHLGGLPALPEDMQWPAADVFGPLGFVAAVDCARLPSNELDIALPASGTLLFFYRDDATVPPSQPSIPPSWPRSRASGTRTARSWTTR